MESASSALAAISTTTCWNRRGGLQIKEIDVESWVGPQQILPILSNPHAASGCGSCGSLTVWHRSDD